ncbi:hypothetical protein B0J12DRAFT_530824, partial [Macrophomina phaseolina]
QRLDRIVVDECHTALDGRGSFRPKLQELGELARAETQMVMLTATLPPAEERRLLDIMNVRGEEVVRFRARTTRANVRYRVVRAVGASKQGELIAAVVQEVRR